MELKDVILSTIAELGDEESGRAPRKRETPKSVKQVNEELSRNIPASDESAKAAETVKESLEESFIVEEREFLERMRERILVLFEGFQSPNNKRVEAKIDLTLNFLEYLLATLDERIATLKKP